MPTAVSLFSGCGGSDKGLIDAGFEILLANDVMPYAREVYRANLPETDFRLMDVAQINSFPEADVLAGCYPCQGFSQGGARQSDRKINLLYQHFGRALREMRPKAFIVENVAGMARTNNLRLLQDQLKEFGDAGYDVTPPEIVNGIDFGLPQERRRIFIVGIRSDLGVHFSFPEPSHGAAGLLPVQTQADSIGDTDGDWPAGEFYDLDFHWYYLSRNRRRDWGMPSNTVLANARHMPLHPMSPPLRKTGIDQWEFDGDASDARRLSYREAASLQDLGGWEFPDVGNLMTKYKVIGNAVPPVMFRRIVEVLPSEVIDA